MDQLRPTLIAAAAALAACTACSLRQTAKAPVMGRGSPTARIVIVGEAPGTEEDAAGSPFVGAAGRILSDMLERAGIPEQQVFITNAVACWPPGQPGDRSRNGKPSLPTVRTCNAHLTAQLMAIAPRVIVALGAFAAGSLMQVSPYSLKMGQEISVPSSLPDPFSFTPRSAMTVEGAALLIGYHPAYLGRLNYWGDPDGAAARSTVATLIAARKMAG